MNITGVWASKNSDRCGDNYNPLRGSMVLQDITS